jgi:hypothetical protein
MRKIIENIKNMFKKETPDWVWNSDYDRRLFLKGQTTGPLMRSFSKQACCQLENGKIGKYSPNGSEPVWRKEY